MWGAVIGDIAGSIYEYGQYRKTSWVTVKNIIENEGFFTDDTILTIAIYHAILTDGDYEHWLKRYGEKYLDYKPKTITNNHFNSTFGILNRLLAQDSRFQL